MAICDSKPNQPSRDLADIEILSDREIEQLSIREIEILIHAVLIRFDSEYPIRIARFNLPPEEIVFPKDAVLARQILQAMTAESRLQVLQNFFFRLRDRWLILNKGLEKKAS